METILRKFASFRDFAAAAQGTTDLQDSERASRTTRQPAWYGTPDFAGAVALADAGWIDGTRQLATRFRHVRSQLHLRTRHPMIRYDLHGVDVDVGRYSMGDAECMLDVLPSVPDATTGRQLLNLAVNLTATSKTSQETYFNRGAAVLALVEALEQSNHAVRILLQEAVRPPGRPKTGAQHYQVDIVLKDHNQALDVSMLAYTVCHISMLRRLLFSIKETEAPGVRRQFEFHGSGRYGVAAAPVANEAIDLYIPAIKPRGDVDWRSQDAVTEWVCGQLAAQGLDVDAV